MIKQLLIIITLFCANMQLVQATIIISSNEVVAASKKKTISAKQAARIVKSNYGGKILKVKSTNSNNKPGYHVRLLQDNGHIISVFVDGYSGQIRR